MNAGGEQVGGAGFVIETALERAIGADERLERFANVGIHRACGGERRFQQLRAQEHQQRFMFVQEFFGNLDVAIGEFVRIQFMRLFMPARFHQIRAIQRAS